MGPSDLITREHTQEALSLAHIHALAGMAGLNLGPRTTFDYGIDGTFWPVKIIDGRRIPSGHPVNFQLKATTNWKKYAGHVLYDLDVRAHQTLSHRERGEPLSILILLCLPKSNEAWMDGCEEYTRLRHCCYWYRVTGIATSNLSSVRIRVPRTNILTPQSLTNIMRTAREEALAGL